MLNYCEVTETPFFYFFFTTGGRPIKLSTGADTQAGSVKVDLVLATLETRHRGGPRAFQQQQQSSYLQPLSQSMVAGTSSDTMTREEDKDQGQGESAAQSRGSQYVQGSQRLLSRDQDTVSMPVSLSPQHGYGGEEQQAGGGDMTSAAESLNGSSVTSRPAKRRPKRLLDSSSDEEG